MPAAQGQNRVRTRPVIQNLGTLYFLKFMKIIGSRAWGKARPADGSERI